MSTVRSTLQSTLGTAYTLEHELGGGGMSTVFVAQDHALGRKVVVKVLPYELAATVSVERFNREILLAAALQHPHIVPVLSAGETDGLPYFVMPFVEGESLRARLQRGPLSVRECVSILKDVARALSFAHARGVVHRDIKPDNVLLSGNSATVTDFGVAKALAAARGGAGRKVGAGYAMSESTITQAGTSLGTPAYMAPEQAAGDPNTDHRADIYALGIVGYEMLSGSPPFHGTTPQKLLAAHLTEPPPPIAARRADVPLALEKLLRRCLAKDPDDRPQSAAELARALDDPAVVSGVFAAAEAPRGPQAKWVAWAAAAVTIGAVAVAAVRFGGAPEPAPPAVVAERVTSPNSIAVLPLVNLGRDTADAYFAEGVTSDLTSALSRIPGIRVASRTAAGLARERHETLEEIARALNVAMLLEGTVQRDGGRLRVTARLINAADGFTVWSDMYEREARDLFAVQDDISAAIVAAVRPELDDDPAPVTLAVRGTSNLQAYDLYLRGRFQMQRRDERSLRAALASFEQALALDSAFARAYTGVADVYALLPLYSGADAATVLPRALATINRALAIDSLLPEAYASRAALLQASWRWTEAERDYRRAIALDPELASARQWYGELLLLLNRVPEGLAQLTRAVELEPLSAIVQGSYSIMLTSAGRLDDGIAAARRAVELDESLAITRAMLGMALLMADRSDEAVRVLEEARALDPGLVQTLGLLGYAYARTGAVPAAREIAAALEARVPGSNGAAAAAARVYLSLGDTERGLALMERSVELREAFFASEPLNGRFFDGVQAEPRFASIRRSAGF